ncbi:hypothetical protein GQ43DRAFT_501740 [Delitschia confertaspora ATCC 74209]|uniref:Uncharacterized protein n=1 Tax=Delitschia confertaspora ATCC 74209 TaxID=1513339 RepID=A0A9P4MWN2_9PLEO|nr:hypothetical protein GQ43DRAFT_501740 [Delitschia confertaspora ATCC 74209]
MLECAPLAEPKVGRERRISNSTSQYTPLLNAVEHILKALQEKTCDPYPHLERIGESEVDWRASVEAAQEAWRQLILSLIHSLIDTMKHRIGAVIGPRGWQTKY